jgi:hypothetical protein
LRIKCPKCRKPLPGGKRELVSFQTVQRGEVSELPLVDREPKEKPRRPKHTIDQSEGYGGQAEGLAPLELLFSTRKKIAVISGAGISTNAGSKSSILSTALPF